VEALRPQAQRPKNAWMVPTESSRRKSEAGNLRRKSLELERKLMLLCSPKNSSGSVGSQRGDTLKQNNSSGTLVKRACSGTFLSSPKKRVYVDMPKLAPITDGNFEMQMPRGQKERSVLIEPKIVGKIPFEKNADKSDSIESLNLASGGNRLDLVIVPKALQSLSDARFALNEPKPKFGDPVHSPEDHRIISRLNGPQNLKYRHKMPSSESNEKALSSKTHNRTSSNISFTSPDGKNRTSAVSSRTKSPRIQRFSRPLFIDTGNDSNTPPRTPKNSRSKSNRKKSARRSSKITFTISPKHSRRHGDGRRRNVHRVSSLSPVLPAEEQNRDRFSFNLNLLPPGDRDPNDGSAFPRLKSATSIDTSIMKRNRNLKWTPTKATKLFGKEKSPNRKSVPMLFTPSPMDENSDDEDAESVASGMPSRARLKATTIG